MTEPLLVLGSGMITAVGFDSAATCAAIRAHVAGFQETGFFRQLPGLEPIIGAIAPMRPRPTLGRPFYRLLAMAEHSLRQCVGKLPISPAQTALLLCTREEYREDLAGAWKASELLVQLQKRLKLAFHPSSVVLPLGNGAVFEALRQASDLLASGTVACCLVGGVDSFLGQPDLAFLEESYRLLGGPIGQGLIPGEAAAFLIINRSAHKEMIAEGKILGIGTDQEADSATVLHGGYPTGRALQRALHAAISAAGIEEGLIDFRVSDLNGESYRGIESMLAMTRFYRSRRPRFDIVHPADCLGETGAAIGAILITIALASMNKGYAPGKLAICETSSDSGLRAACLVGT